MVRKYTYRLDSEGFAELEAQFKSLGEKGEAAFEKAKTSITGFGDAAERAQKRAAEAAKRMEEDARGSFQSLQASLDPAIAAQQQLARGRETVTTAQRLGVATDIEAAAAMGQLEQRYATATAGVSGFARGLDVAKTALGAFGIALGAAEIIRFGVELFKSTAELEKQSKVLGVGVEALQAYRAAAVQNSVDVATADAIIQRFTRSIGEANEASGAQRQAFMQLKLSASDLAGGPEASLPKVAAALLQIEDVTRRARLEAVLFGKSGQEIEAVLRGWADPDIVAHMKDMGLVIDKELVKRADDFDRAWNVAWLKFKVGLVDAANLVLSQQARFELAAKIAERLTAPSTKGTAAAPGTTATSVTIPIKDPLIPFAGPDTLAIAAKSATESGIGDWTNVLQRRMEAMKEEIRLAGLLSTERKVELETITLAQAVQRERGDQEDKLVQTYAAAKTIVGETAVEQLRQNAYLLAQATAMGALRESLTAIAGYQPQVLKGLEKETKERIDAAVAAGINAQNEADILKLKREARALREDEYLAEQVRLASLLPEYREAEMYILQQELMLNEKLSDQRKEEIHDEFALIQQAERLTSVAQDMRGQFKDFWMEFAVDGRLNTKDLFRSIKADFASLLYDMLIEAQLRPIMINMAGQMQSAIGGIGNWLGLSTGYGSAAGSGAAGYGGVGGGAQMLGSMIGQPSLLNSFLPQSGGGYATVDPSGTWTPGPQGFPGGGGSAAGGYAMMGAAAVNMVVDAIQGDPNKKNTRLSGAVKGAATGAAIGTMIFPGIGTVIGAVIGAIVGIFGGHDKPSNYTAYATFDPGLTEATFAGDKPNANTTKAATQAAQLILQEGSLLRTLGVSFGTSLANVWIGQRDVSSYQLSNAKRVAIGTVGDPNDLAFQAIKALIQSSTTNSPAMSHVLGRDFTSLDELNKAVGFVHDIYDVVIQGRPALTQVEQAMKSLIDTFKKTSQQARELGLDVGALAAGVKKSFDSDVRLAIEQIQDPLKYALELWQRDAQARLDTAASIGADLGQVRQLNELLRQQAVTQASGGLVSGLQGLISGLQYGPGSANAPDVQYFASLTDYNRAKSAALGSLSPSDISAYQSAAQTFLPIARGFLGTSQQYGALTADVTSTSQQLVSGLMAPPPVDLTPVVSAQTDTTYAVQDVRQEVSNVKDEIRGLRGVLEAIARRIT